VLVHVATQVITAFQESCKNMLFLAQWVPGWGYSKQTVPIVISSIGKHNDWDVLIQVKGLPYMYHEAQSSGVVGNAMLNQTQHA
jgi:hypothetical protein